MSRIRVSSVLALLLLSLTTTLPAMAAVQSTTASVVAVPAPSSVVPGQTTSDTDVLAFNEQQCVTLKKILSVNANKDGEVPFPFIGIPIAAGSVVSCHFLHFDPETSGYAKGTVTFDADILGVIVDDVSMDLSDPVCGLPGTTYPTGTYQRGAEQPTDRVAIVHATRTVEIDWAASDPGDQIRVITRCAPTGIPEIEAKLDRLEPQLLDNQAALEAKLDALQSQMEELHQILDALRQELAKIETKIDML